MGGEETKLKHRANAITRRQRITRGTATVSSRGASAKISKVKVGRNTRPQEEHDANLVTVMIQDLKSKSVGTYTSSSKRNKLKTLLSTLLSICRVPQVTSLLNTKSIFVLITLTDQRSGLSVKVRISRVSKAGESSGRSYKINIIEIGNTRSVFASDKNPLQRSDDAII